MTKGYGYRYFHAGSLDRVPKSRPVVNFAINTILYGVALYGFVFAADYLSNKDLGKVESICVSENVENINQLGMMTDADGDRLRCSIYGNFLSGINEANDTKNMKELFEKIRENDGKVLVPKKVMNPNYDIN